MYILACADLKTPTNLCIKVVVCPRSTLYQCVLLTRRWWVYLRKPRTFNTSTGWTNTREATLTTGALILHRVTSLEQDATGFQMFTIALVDYAGIGKCGLLIEGKTCTCRKSDLQSWPKGGGRMKFSEQTKVNLYIVLLCLSPPSCIKGTGKRNLHVVQKMQW